MNVVAGTETKELSEHTQISHIIAVAKLAVRVNLWLSHRPEQHGALLLLSQGGMELSCAWT